MACERLRRLNRVVTSWTMFLIVRWSTRAVTRSPVSQPSATSLRPRSTLGEAGEQRATRSAPLRWRRPTWSRRLASRSAGTVPSPRARGNRGREPLTARVAAPHEPRHARFGRREDAGVVEVGDDEHHPALAGSPERLHHLRGAGVDVIGDDNRHLRVVGRRRGAHVRREGPEFGDDARPGHGVVGLHDKRDPLHHRLSPSALGGGFPGAAHSASNAARRDDDTCRLREPQRRLNARATPSARCPDGGDAAGQTRRGRDAGGAAPGGCGRGRRLAATAVTSAPGIAMSAPAFPKTAAPAIGEHGRHDSPRAPRGSRADAHRVWARSERRPSEPVTIASPARTRPMTRPRRRAGRPTLPLRSLGRRACVRSSQRPPRARRWLQAATTARAPSARACRRRSAAPRRAPPTAARRRAAWHGRRRSACAVHRSPRSVPTRRRHRELAGGRCDRHLLVLVGALDRHPFERGVPRVLEPQLEGGGRLPSARSGRSTRWSSRNGRIVTGPAARRPPSGYAPDVTLTRAGSPRRRLGTRGGWKVTCSSPPGRARAEAALGSAVDHSAVPITSTTRESSTVPALRRRTCTAAVPPGSHTTSEGDTLIVTPGVGRGVAAMPADELKNAFLHHEHAGVARRRRADPKGDAACAPTLAGGRRRAVTTASAPAFQGVRARLDHRPLRGLPNTWSENSSASRRCCTPAPGTPPRRQGSLAPGPRPRRPPSRCPRPRRRRARPGRRLGNRLLGSPKRQVGAACRVRAELGAGVVPRQALRADDHASIRSLWASRRGHEDEVGQPLFSLGAPRRCGNPDVENGSRGHERPRRRLGAGSVDGGDGASSSSRAVVARRPRPCQGREPVPTTASAIGMPGVTFTVAWRAAGTAFVGSATSRPARRRGRCAGAGEPAPSTWSPRSRPAPARGGGRRGRGEVSARLRRTDRNRHRSVAHVGEDHPVCGSAVRLRLPARRAPKSRRRPTWPRSPRPPLRCRGVASVSPAPLGDAVVRPSRHPTAGAARVPAPAPLQLQQ